MSTPYYEQEASYEFRNQVVTFRSYLNTYEIFRSVKIAMQTLVNKGTNTANVGDK